MTLENGNGTALDSVVLYLNPGLRITTAQAEGTPVGVRRRNQAAVLDLRLEAGERREVELRYEGGISPSVMYAEVEDLQAKEAETKFFIFQPGCELFCLTEDYTLLTPECLWYPTAQPPVDVDMPYFTMEDFTRYALDVVGTGGRMAISQGRQSANGDTTRFRNAENLSGISLCVGDYVRRAIKTDTLDMSGMFPHIPDFQLEDTILCEVYVLKGHEHLLEKLRDARKDLAGIRACAQSIRDPELSGKAQRLARTADGILDYLEKHPDHVEGARRFLEYYQVTAAALLNRYVALQQEEMKTEEDGHLKQSACRAVDALTQAFEKQYRNLLQNELMDMDAEIQVIEQMIKMEGLL